MKGKPATVYMRCAPVMYLLTDGQTDRQTERGTDRVITIGHPLGPNDQILCVFFIKCFKVQRITIKSRNWLRYILNDQGHHNYSI